MSLELSEALAHIADVLNDPVIEAITRASRAKLGERRYIEPVSVLRQDDIILVLVRVGLTRPRHSRSTTNQFRILNAMGMPVLIDKASAGLSTIAYLLRDAGWAKAEIIAADDDTVRLTSRFRRLLQQPNSLNRTREIA